MTLIIEAVITGLLTGGVYALMASGLNGQQFAFHGYLPIDSKEVSQRIKSLEKESAQKNQTQMGI